MVSHWGHQCDLASPSPLATSGLIHLRAPYKHFLGHNMEMRWKSLGKSIIADACFASDPSSWSQQHQPGNLTHSRCAMCDESLPV